MKRSMLFLIFALPGAAVLMGILMVVLAFSEPDQGVRQDAVPLSKISWQEAE
jgi:hypothetical protein